MKKTLLLQTALVAAAGLFVADIANAQTKEVPLGLTVGGYYNQLLQWQDRSPNGGQSDHGIKQDSEIHFNFRGVLANGTVIGGRVELESATYGDQIDEAYMFIEHAEFGRTEIGSMDSPTTKMIYGAPNSLPNYSTTVQSEYSAVNNAPLMRFANNMDDANRINAYTASNRYFGSKAGKGLQLGVGYAPDNCQDLTTASGAASATAVTSGQQGCGTGFFTPNTVVGLEQQFNAGANYLESFGAFDVALYAGYNSVKVIGAGAATSPSSRETGYQGGALFTWNVGDGSSVQFGGAITNEDVTAVRERKGWTAGVRYLTNGAAPGSVGIGFEYADRNESNSSGATTRVGDLEYWHVGLTYQVAAGILGFAGVGVSDTTDHPTAASNIDQTFGVVGINLTF
ncbi:porin [Ferrovibrio terrae]|uniref:Porin n=1 Tax=Ferrovibrio terrae TaxID=2594003 RepID=A0A516GZ06_9PROT|nr:porin [Ferrovibrio terrae]QDO96580.1 porin [Ferrovibrio terrae]